jgi:hypothetical protein
MGERYGHRNGETEPPTEPGFFWSIGDVTVEEDRVSVAGTIFFAEWHEGAKIAKLPDGRFVTNGTEAVGVVEGKWDCRWWGPVTPPWWDNEA